MTDQYKAFVREFRRRTIEYNMSMKTDLRDAEPLACDHIRMAQIRHRHERRGHAPDHQPSHGRPV